MPYINNRRRGRVRRSLQGLGGVENCGADQVYDPNITAFGIKGQCMPRANYQASQLENPNAFPGVVKSASSGSSGTSFLASLLSAFTSPSTPQPPVYTAPPPSSGMSTTTMLAIGAVGLGVLYVATRK